MFFIKYEDDSQHESLLLFNSKIIYLHPPPLPSILFVANTPSDETHFSPTE